MIDPVLLLFPLTSLSIVESNGSSPCWGSSSSYSRCNSLILVHLSKERGAHTSVIKHMMMFISYILTQENEDLALFYIVNADFSSSFRSVWHSYCVWHLILII